MTALVMIDGPEAESRVASALSAVAGALPYLQAAQGPPTALAQGAEVTDGDWLCCDELLADDAWLEATMLSAGRRLGTAEAPVAASLFVLGYSYRVLALAIACLLVGGAAPGSRPEAMAVALSKGYPSLIAYRRPKALVLADGGMPAMAAFEDETAVTQALGFVLAEAVEAHMRPLVEAACARVRVGRRLLWGNVAASAAVAFSTMEALQGEWVKALGEGFFAMAPAELQGQGSFLTLEYAGRRGWYWERRNCCLNDRLPEHVRCRDCSLTPTAERRARYWADLAGVADAADLADVADVVGHAASGRRPRPPAAGDEGGRRPSR